MDILYFKGKKYQLVEIQYPYYIIHHGTEEFGEPCSIIKPIQAKEKPVGGRKPPF